MDTVEVLDKLFRLKELYEKRAGSHADYFVRWHFSTKTAIKRQIHSVLMYKKYISGRVLDWGCRYAPDACILRMFYDNDIDIYGCDVCEAEGYEGYTEFYDFSGIKYTPLKHPYLLPYEDDYFDSVISSGVLEHVPIEYESIKEVYRILKPDGYFIITFLPNRFSYTETLSQLIGRGGHKRRYSLKQTKEMLLRIGFQTIESRYFQMVPSLMSGLPMGREVTDFLWPLNGLFEKIWPLNRLSSNLFIVCVKRSSM